jgi:hypothetical protein
MAGEDNAKERRTQRLFSCAVFAIFPSLRCSPFYVVLWIIETPVRQQSQSYNPVNGYPVLNKGDTT